MSRFLPLLLILGLSNSALASPPTIPVRGDWLVRPSECNYITCDCENLDFGLLTREYRKECRAVETDIRKKCYAGVPFHKLRCHTTAVGPHPWPTDDVVVKPTPEEHVDRVLDELCKQLANDPDYDPRARALRQIRGMGKEHPGLAISAHAGLANLRQQEAEFYAGFAGDVMGTSPDRDALAQGAEALIRAQHSLDDVHPTEPDMHAKVNRLVEIAVNAGIAIETVFEGETELLEWLKTAQEWDKAGLSADQLRALGIDRGKKFVDDAIDLVPTSVGFPNGPAVIAFRDSVAWTRKMTEECTAGLDLVSKAIETGKFDDAAYAKVALNLKNLAHQGPWGRETLRDGIKKWAEQIPLIGNLVKVFWGDSDDEPPNPFGPGGYCEGRY